MKTRVKIAAFAVAWLVALFCVDFNFKWAPLIYMFPMGLFQFLGPVTREAIGGWAAMIGGWLIYIGQGVFYFRARTVAKTVLWLVVLVALLTVNAAGCHQMVHGH